MPLPAAIEDLVRINGPDQHYACCSTFLGHTAEAQLSTSDLQQQARQSALMPLAITTVQGRAWLLQGPLVVLRPTDHIEGEVLAADIDVVNNLVGAIDAVGSLRYHVVAASAARQWAVQLHYAGIPGKGIGSLRTHFAASLEEALHGAVQGFLVEHARQPESR